MYDVMPSRRDSSALPEVNLTPSLFQFCSGLTRGRGREVNLTPALYTEHGGEMMTPSTVDPAGLENSLAQNSA